MRITGVESRPPEAKGGFPVLARSSSLRVHAWALSSNHNARQLILIRCKHSQRVARSFVRGLENRLKACCRHQVFYDKFLYKIFFAYLHGQFCQFSLWHVHSFKASMLSFEQVHFIHSHRKSRKKFQITKNLVCLYGPAKKIWQNNLSTCMVNFYCVNAGDIQPG
jgi:hypothetical protein